MTHMTKLINRKVTQVKSLNNKVSFIFLHVQPVNVGSCWINSWCA